MIRFAKTLISYVFILTFACWVIGFCIFCVYAFSFKYTLIQPADTIVALTGGNDRIRAAVSLLQNDMAPRLLISGVNTSISTDLILKTIPQEAHPKIDLGYQAANTRENATETAEWIQKNNAKSMILVTSFYHMPRSIFEIQRRLPRLKIIAHPVFPRSFNDSFEWLRTRYAWQLFLEYNKFLITITNNLIKEYCL